MEMSNLSKVCVVLNFFVTGLSLAAPYIHSEDQDKVINIMWYALVANFFCIIHLITRD